jgi:beta-lactamase superfamily II metal-dependent hydrolase
MEQKGYEIDLLPVGDSTKSGDCIALRFGNLYAGKRQQHVIIIDGGYSTTKDELKNHLDKYYNCKINGKYVINLVILSHPDLDHVSGIVELLKDDDFKIYNIVANFPWNTLDVKWFKDGRITDNSLEVRLQDAFNKLSELEELANDNNVQLFNPTHFAKTVKLSDAKLTFLGPSRAFYNQCISNCSKTPEQAENVDSMKYFSANNQDNDSIEESYSLGDKIDWYNNEGTTPINESSIIFLFEYEGHKILFTGDAGKEALENAIDFAHKSGIDLSNIDIIKMPHHGSRKNVNPDIMDDLKGKETTCYISCVADDLGHHPSKRLLNMLIDKGYKVYSTSGTTLHRGWNAPDRGWPTAKAFEIQNKMDK